METTSDYFRSYGLDINAFNFLTQLKLLSKDVGAAKKPPDGSKGEDLPHLENRHLGSWNSAIPGMIKETMKQGIAIGLVMEIRLKSNCHRHCLFQGLTKMRGMIAERLLPLHMQRIVTSSDPHDVRSQKKRTLSGRCTRGSCRGPLHARGGKIG